MKDRIDAIERTLHCACLTDITVNELSFGIEILRSAIAVHLWHEQVKHPHAVTALNQRIG